MKNSELYHLAQVAVINSPSIAPESKIKIVRLLLEDEDLELYQEKQKEKQEQATAEN